MGDLNLSKSAIERIERIRGRLHPYETISAAKTALVVIDMQNVFLAETSFYSVAAAPDIVPNVNRLAAAVRDNGGTVVWIRMAFDPARPWRNFYGAMLRPDIAEAMRAALTPGADGHALWPALEVHPDDPIIDKTRFSAFLPESSPIAAELRGRAIDTVLITGTVTNTCCETSARDAAMMDFNTVMVSDGCAAALPELHQATLRNFIQVSGDVRTTDEVIAMMDASAGAAAAAE